MERKLVKIPNSCKFKTSGRRVFLNTHASYQRTEGSSELLLIACPSVCESCTFVTSLKSLAQIYPTFKVCTKRSYGKGVVKLKNRKQNPFQREGNHK